jgi:hypothetical protein
MCHAKKLGEQILQLTDDVNKLLEEYTRQLSNIDIQISDVLHFIENEKFNASQGYAYAKKLKQLRVERRKIKTEIEPLRMLNATTLKTLHPLKCTLGGITKKDEEVQKYVTGEKKYTPKAITKEEVFLQ